jgi:hypothetical protein
MFDFMYDGDVLIFIRLGEKVYSIAPIELR